MPRTNHRLDSNPGFWCESWKLYVHHPLRPFSCDSSAIYKCCVSISQTNVVQARNKVLVRVTKKWTFVSMRTNPMNYIMWVFEELLWGFVCWIYHFHIYDRVWHTSLIVLSKLGRAAIKQNLSKHYTVTKSCWLRTFSMTHTLITPSKWYVVSDQSFRFVLRNMII